MSDSETPVENGEVKRRFRSPTKTRSKQKIKNGATLGVGGKALDIISDHMRGLNNREIAKLRDVGERSVYTVLEKWEPVFSRLKDVPDFRQARLSILEATELRILESLADEVALSKASYNNRAYAFDIISKARAREQGIADGSSTAKTFITVNISLASEYKDSQKPETPEPLASSPAIPTTSELMAITAPDSEPDKEP